MTGLYPTRRLKIWLVVAVTLMMISATGLLIWRSGHFREHATLADGFHQRSTYLASEIIGDLARLRIADSDPDESELSARAYLTMTTRQLEQLRSLEAGFELRQWSFLLDTLTADVDQVERRLTDGGSLATAVEAATLTAEQLKRAHRIEYERLIQHLDEASAVDRGILIAFAGVVFLLTVLLTNWLINRLLDADRARAEVIAELERKNDELTRFTYTVSHDLKSPLITIGGFSSLLDDDIAVGDLDAARRDARQIRGGIGRMQQLLDDLLALSVAGKSVEERRPVALELLVERVVRVVAGSEDGGRARFVIDPGLPTVLVDESRLAEAIRNLLENAVKFMGDQADPQITIGQRGPRSRPVFFVRDNGRGIEKQDLERAFDLFERLHPGTSGTGIGLAIARRVIESHGGQLWAESEGAGRGATFCFTLGA